MVSANKKDSTAKAVDAAKVYMKEYYENNKSAIKLSQNEKKDAKQLRGNSKMNVNLHRFTRTWPSAMVGMAEGKEVEEEDELGEKIFIMIIFIITQKPFTKEM